MVFLDTLHALCDRLSERRQRALLWVAAPASEAISRAHALWRGRGWRAPLWLGPDPGLDGIAALPAAKARIRLGGEHDLVIVDAVSPSAGFDPDAFGAISGTLRGGGLLVLLTPETWRSGVPTPDSDYARLAAWPHTAESLSARFLARLARRLTESPQVLRWSSDTAPLASGLPDADISTASAPPDDPACLTLDQAQAVRGLTRLRRRRPLVLTADRGRGKSAALGIAAARRLQAGERRLWVTAPRPASVAPLFERLSTLLPEGRSEGNTYHARIGDAEAEVRFLAPDALLEALHETDVDPKSPPTLFVDEAAAIPTPLLGRWLAAFPRIAFATTVHGYEGTGRGFALRFRERLERESPDWRELHLVQPVRWAEGDPLEAVTREILLLDAEPADEARAAEALAAHPLRIVPLDRDALASDDDRLGELFGLLVQAHYRTTPADLRQLLDGPDTHLLAAYVGEVCIGVCQASEEGGFPAHLAQAIAWGERRPRGHLLAQSLAAHAGQVTAAEARWCRVTRIAVHPAARRRGVGRALIDALAQGMAGRGIGRLGVSFGAEISLLAFWRTLGFVSLRIGLSREAASGEHAVMMGRALDTRAAAELAQFGRDYRRLLPSLLAFELGRLEPELAAALLREGEPPVIDETTRARVAWFAQGGGELAAVRPWLAMAWLAWWRDPGRMQGDAELVAFAGPVFQGGDGSPSAGRKARLAHWRDLAGRLLAWLETRRRENPPLQPGIADGAGHIGDR
ncbi:GNAT family N-acetyltransferase [Halomonas sp. McH1-25]|uniref:tRNA(Met) cytidine acetyltransferase TmcA n=1 Tax=unclassified Halomonas TaxID=2609666 RepID=UPI001EF45712|nr:MULTISPECIES: GNAT family N-acetyltransferase [unclassified Halomonas]MCG7601387.1 GNAT family N-acetyltransferase [Halomonas sp. McH1-25]MCP1341928.1 GNAT family N-acetyltransferase [Halomonas sp. FL8]MCP1361772.1 GNAT family N-acetyltransferase [Halomonas sp. BBD45]